MLYLLKSKVLNSIMGSVVSIMNIYLFSIKVIAFLLKLAYNVCREKLVIIKMANTYCEVFSSDF